jgi:hypothetical protein
VARRLGADTIYLLAGLPLAVVSFSLLIALFAFSLGTLVVPVLGIPALALALLTARAFADLERVRLRAVDEAPVVRPAYRRVDPGAGLIARLLTPIRDGQSWLDLLHGILGFVLALVGFVFAVTWWALALGGLTWPIWGRFIPDGNGDDVVVREVMGQDTDHNRLILYVAIGAVAFVTLPLILRGFTAVRAGFARALLLSVSELRSH